MMAKIFCYFAFLFFSMNLVAQPKNNGIIKKVDKYNIEIVKVESTLLFYFTHINGDSINIKSIEGSVFLKYDQKEALEKFSTSNTDFISVPMIKSYFKKGVLNFVIDNKTYQLKFYREDLFKITKEEREEKTPHSHQGHTH